MISRNSSINFTRISKKARDLSLNIPLEIMAETLNLMVINLCYMRVDLMKTMHVMPTSKMSQIEEKLERMCDHEDQILIIMKSKRL